MNRYLVFATLLLGLAAPAVAGEVADQLLRTPVTQMDLGIERMAAALAPVFESLAARGAVDWNPADSRIEIRVAIDRSPTDTASWDPARRAAAAIRRELGVDPEWGRILAGREGALAALFSCARGRVPPGEDLAGLVRLRIAVRSAPMVSPTHYVGDLLDSDVRLDSMPGR